MKKASLLLIGLLLAAGVSQAQNVNFDFIPFHSTGYNALFMRNIMQQHNGDVVSNTFIGWDSGNNQQPPIAVGNLVYKISPSSLEITDSLFNHDTIAYYLFAKDPRGEGNLRINAEANGENGAILRISHFSDDDLNINPDEDVLVPLYDGPDFNFAESYFIDSNGDVIVKYYTNRPEGGFDGHFARCGLDGILKHEAEIPEYQYFTQNMDEFRESPLEYYEWNRNSSQCLALYVLDADFHVKNTYVVNKDYLPEEEHFTFNNSGTFVIPDGDDILVATEYMRDSGGVYREHGAAVARYELRTMRLKNLMRFNDFLGQQNNAKCLCFQKASNGSLYFVYKEPSTSRWMTAVKMDSELNVIWQRQCYPVLQANKAYQNWVAQSFLLNDEEGNEKGIAIAGYSTLNQSEGLFYFFLTDDDILRVGDMEVEIRPYAFYPNPAQTELHLQYSPDVQPTGIELYDLQGRLVRTQNKDLESINMEGLPAGTYTMRVMLEGGKVYSDKVVKE